jgi:dCTP diphosphatase
MCYVVFTGYMGFEASTTMEELRRLQKSWVVERNWTQFHSPRNLVLALVGEVGELAELFQWRGEVACGLPGWTEGRKLQHHFLGSFDLTS